MTKVRGKRREKKIFEKLQYLRVIHGKKTVFGRGGESDRDRTASGLPRGVCERPRTNITMGQYELYPWKTDRSKRGGKESEKEMAPWQVLQWVWMRGRGNRNPNTGTSHQSFCAIG